MNWSQERFDIPTATCLRQQQSQIWSTLTPRCVFCHLDWLLLDHQSWTILINWHWPVLTQETVKMSAKLCVQWQAFLFQDVSRWILRADWLGWSLKWRNGPSGGHHTLPSTKQLTTRMASSGRNLPAKAAGEEHHWFFGVEHCRTKPCSSMFIHVHPCSSMFIHIHPCSSMFIHVHPCSLAFGHHLLPAGILGSLGRKCYKWYQCKGHEVQTRCRRKPCRICSTYWQLPRRTSPWPACETRLEESWWNSRRNFQSMLTKMCFFASCFSSFDELFDSQWQTGRERADVEGKVYRAAGKRHWEPLGTTGNHWEPLGTTGNHWEPLGTRHFCFNSLGLQDSPDGADLDPLTVPKCVEQLGWFGRRARADPIHIIHEVINLSCVCHVLSSSTVKFYPFNNYARCNHCGWPVYPRESKASLDDRMFHDINHPAVGVPPF